MLGLTRLDGEPDIRGLVNTTIVARDLAVYCFA